MQTVFGSEFPFGAQHLHGIVQAHAAGHMAGINDMMEKLTAHRPESVAEFVERNRDAFK
ncbi:hypothetical protein PQQ73_00700 [Paraburkholderia strydomiana]|uniref:Uncharacterized protein n=1 Tax=Paraburkholderia strydomiana TaxID=1245417 RepID=A0ABW9E710_9BURK